MTDYPRACSIIADGAGSLNMAALRCRFSIRQFTRQSPNLATIRITNQLPATARKLVAKEYSKLTVQAGYPDNIGVIFSGNIVFATYGRDPDASTTDTLTTIWCGDGETKHNYATVNKTLAAGSTPQDHVNVALQAMAPDIVKGFIGVDLSTPKYPRAVTLFGMAREVLAKVGRLKQADVSYQNGQLQMVTKQQSIPGGDIVMNSQTGLVGMPTQSIEGILVRCLINPQIKINTVIKVDQGDIQAASPTVDISGTGVNEAEQFKIPSLATDGRYKVLQINADGDTRGNPWYMDLACINAAGTGNVPPNLSFANVPGQ